MGTPITIELEKVEALKAENEQLNLQMQELKEGLSRLDEKVLKRSAVDLSLRLFKAYAKQLYRTIGSEDVDVRIDFKPSLIDALRQEYWDEAEMEFEIGANVSSLITAYYMKLGFDTKRIQGKKNPIFSIS